MNASKFLSLSELVQVRAKGTAWMLSSERVMVGHPRRSADADILTRRTSQLVKLVEETSVRDIC